MNTLLDELVEDLKNELSVTDSNLSETLLKSKVKSAIREVKTFRNYPNSYTEMMISEDLNNFYGNIRNIALYDYSQVGAEFQTSLNENSVSRQWKDRDSLFNGIIPLAKL